MSLSLHFWFSPQKPTTSTSNHCVVTQWQNNFVRPLIKCNRRLANGCTTHVWRESINNGDADLNSPLLYHFSGRLPEGSQLLDKDNIVKIKRCLYSLQRSGMPPVTTHNIVDDWNDPVLNSWVFEAPKIVTYRARSLFHVITDLRCDESRRDYSIRKLTCIIFVEHLFSFFFFYFQFYIISIF